MADRLHAVRSPATVVASAVLGLVFLWRLPSLAQAAGYLAIVGAGVAAVALAAALRVLAGRLDGRILAAGAALVAFAGLTLNAVVGLPAGQQLRGGVGWAGAVTLASAVVIGFLGVRDLGRSASAKRAR